MKKVLILGNDWHGNWSLSLATEMEAQGYHVQHINVRPQVTTSIGMLARTQKRYFLARTEHAIRATVDNESVSAVIVITPYTLPYTLWQYIRNKKVPLIGWWGDNPFTKGDMRHSIPLFDRVYLNDMQWVTSARFLNPQTFFLPHAGRPSVFRPSTIEPNTIDVVFIGDSYGGTAMGWYRASVLEHLHNHNISIALYGDSYWLEMAKQKPFLNEIYQGPILDPNELNSAYNRAHIILNIHHHQLVYGTNQRTFEAALAGVFQISDVREDVLKMFGDTIATYTTPKELTEAVEYYLAHPEERQKSADAARHIALGQHTYEHRIQSLLKGIV